MLVIGVRSSWLTVERKSFFVWSSWASRSTTSFSEARASCDVALLPAALGDVLGHGEVAGRGAGGGVPAAEGDRGGEQGAVGAPEAPVRDVGVVRGVQQRADGGVQARRLGRLLVAERDGVLLVAAFGEHDRHASEQLARPGSR